MQLSDSLLDGLLRFARDDGGRTRGWWL